MDLGGVILSGGPASVYGADAPAVPRALLELGVPVLGICYGMQWMCSVLGGRVDPSDRREYGRTSIAVRSAEGLLEGIEGETVVWMSHGDNVVAVPAGFRTLAASKTCEHAVAVDPTGRLWGVQFHPEVSHTLRGREVLANFLTRICELPGDWRPESIVEREVAKIRAQVGADGEVVLGLSGGVDSSVAALILHRAIGARCHCIFVDNGLLRRGERVDVERTFREHFHMDLTVVDARERFLARLAGVTDPEQKRKRIGHEFVDVFREEARRVARARFLTPP
jgi:GMP synthase (glutamine-hydrolysing)